jgi:type I restriction enzyme S subunit
MEEYPFSSLGKLLRLERRPVNIIADKEYAEIGVYCFGKGIFHKEPRSGLEVGDKKLFLITEGDFILQVTFAWEGAVGLASNHENGMYGSTRFPTFRVNENLCYPPFLVNYFKTQEGRNQLIKISPGSAGRNRVLSLKRILEVQVPLPSLDEQRRIVARIEELATRIEEARELRRLAVEEANVMIPSFLGKLFGSLAKQFDVISLDRLSSHITDGPHKTPTYVSNGIPFITVKNMVSGKLNFDDFQYITIEDHLEFSKRCKPELGDVLYSKDGATRGHPCLVDTDREFNIFVSVALIKPIRDRLDGRYLCYVLKSTWIKERMAAKSRGDMIPHIVLKEIRNFPIPTPPIDDQRHIVAYLDNMQSKLDALKCLQNETAAELDALMPSILDRAFRGEL